MAKEAADIVILDDNFSSIVKSVLWGRSVFGNIRKFLQFQLTVNLVALVLAFIAAITSGETPLNVLQLLWVNLIMDALGALGAQESPLILRRVLAGRRILCFAERTLYALRLCDQDETPLLQWCCPRSSLSLLRCLSDTQLDLAAVSQWISMQTGGLGWMA